MYLKVVIFVLCALIEQGFGLTCYSCAFSSVDTDQSCLTITDETNSVTCPYTYCTIVRQEFLDPSGVVASFMRGCTSEPDFLNHEVEDYNYRTFYRSCTSDLCNIGNGIESVGGNGLMPRPQYTGENLLVPGTGNSAGKLQITSLSTLFVMILAYVMF